MEPREVLGVDEIPRPIEEREGAFAALGREKPLPFMPEVHIPELPLPRGRYEHLLEVGRTAAAYSSRCHVDRGPAAGVQRVLRQHDPQRRPTSRPATAELCLGANLARREIQVMFRQLFRRLPELEITGAPDRVQSNFINGIKRMPCAFTPGPRLR